jgi:hypothetical protein
MMKRAVIKIPFIVAVLTSDNRVGYYTGAGFDTMIKNAKRYANKGMATIQGSKFVGQPGVKYIGVYPATANPKKQIIPELKKGLSAISKAKARNPITGSKKRRVKKAQALFEDFTGHKADNYEIVELPDYDTALKVGNVTGIMYETTRDGKIEHYIHEFRKASQPVFAVSHDGQQVFLVGGAYLFKDSGINDI